MSGGGLKIALRYHQGTKLDFLFFKADEVEVEVKVEVGDRL